MELALDICHEHLQKGVFVSTQIEVIMALMSGLIISLVAIVATHIFSYVQSRQKYKFELLEKAYFSLYWKFEHLFLTKTSGAFNFSDLNNDLRLEFISVLLEGYPYADRDLKALITEMRWAFHSDNDEDTRNTTEIDEKFIQVSKHISDEGNKIAKKIHLHLPKW